MLDKVRGQLEEYGYGDEGGVGYQFAAMIGLPKGLTLFDLGFILIFGIEDLFFFF